jgi:hypothetical protein
VSDKSPLRIWQIPLAIAVAAFVLLVIHYVFHRPVFPELVIFLALIGIGIATKWPAIIQRWKEKRKPPPRNT